MVEKLLRETFVPVVGLSAIRRGDVFRTIDGGLKGPVLVAAADAEQVPHPRDPARRVWRVQTVQN